MRTIKRKLGDLGESLACRLLVKNGFKIIERNFLRQCGEIDIISSKKNIIYFVEVKTVTRKTNIIYKKRWGEHISEENVGFLKKSRLRKVVSLYLKENKINKDWKFMVISVYVEKLNNEKLRIKYNVLYDVL